MEEQFIGNYKILKKIGSGGMAKVYLAVHKDVPNLRVVLKILSDSRLVERFKQEADKLALLDGNPHICQIKHFFNHGDDFVIAMEYIDGSVLDDIIKDRGKLSIDESVKITGDVLNILEFAHQKGIFHRDIKPGNIMIDRNGQVKVIDFGIAKAANDPNLTLAGTACGTPAYMSPEQFNPTDKVDYTLVDIYAVGTTLYYMLTGELPFKGDNEFALRDAKMFNKPEKPGKLNHEIPKALEDIVLKTLEKNPQDRFLSCHEMQRALKPFFKDVKPVSLTGETVDQATRPQVKKRKKSFLWPTIGGLAIIILAALTYKLFFSEKTENPPPVIPERVELTAPTPLAPETNSITDKAIPTFRWEKSAITGVVYNLEYDRDSLFVKPVTATYLTATEYTPLEPLETGQYFWHIQSEDTEGKQSRFSSIQTFTIAPASVTSPVDTVIPAPQAHLAIKVSPGGDIFIDNQLQGRNKTSLELTLDTSRHTIKVTNQNSIEKTIERPINLTENARLTENFTFTFPPPKPEQITVKVKIGSRPLNGATVYIDGSQQVLKTPNTYELTPGTHVIKGTLTNSEGNTLEKTDTLEVIEGVTDKHFIEFKQ